MYRYPLYWIAHQQKPCNEALSPFPIGEAAQPVVDGSEPLVIILEVGTAAPTVASRREDMQRRLYVVTLQGIVIQCTVDRRDELVVVAVDENSRRRGFVDAFIQRKLPGDSGIVSIPFTEQIYDRSVMPYPILEDMTG